jgi:hypothetical protein
MIAQVTWPVQRTMKVLLAPSSCHLYSHTDDRPPWQQPDGDSADRGV